MKTLIKLAAVLIAVSGAVGLGFLISVISSTSSSVSGIVMVLVALFAGGALLIGAFIFLWLYANGDLKQRNGSDSSDTGDGDSDSEPEAETAQDGNAELTAPKSSLSEPDGNGEENERMGN